MFGSAKGFLIPIFPSSTTTTTTTSTTTEAETTTIMFVKGGGHNINPYYDTSTTEATTTMLVKNGNFQPYYDTSTTTNDHQIDPNIPVEIIWNWSTILETMILTLIVLGTIFGNALVLLAMKLNRNKNLRSSTHYFIANLATADLFVGIFVLPFLAIFTISGNWYFGQTYCTIWAYIHFWLCSASILSVCAICIDRYVGVSFPLKHYRLMNKHKVIMISCGVWAIALALGAIPLAVWPEPPSLNSYECKINQQLGHVLIASIGILYIPTIIMLVLYGLIYYITVQHFNVRKEGLYGEKGNIKVAGGGRGRRASSSTGLTSTSGMDSQSTNSTSGTSVEISSNSNNTNSNLTKKVSISIEESSEGSKSNGEPKIQNGNRKNSTFTSYVDRKSVAEVQEQDQLMLTRNKQIRVAKKLAIVVGAFLFSYVPFFTVFLIRALHPNSISIGVFLFFGWIRYFNSCLNPIIYAAMLPAFTKSFKNILCCKFRG